MADPAREGVGVGERGSIRPKNATRLADPEYRLELDTAKAWGLTPSQFRELPESDQDEMLAHFRDICPACGNLRSTCSDPEATWYPQRTMCYASAVRDLTRRKVTKKYGEEPGTSDLHPTDGMSVWASSDDLTPDDHFV